MNAIQFIKEHGVDAARIVIGCADMGEIDTQNTNDLKRLVESIDYVGIHGYEKSKEILKNAPVGAECYSWSLGNSGVRDKTVELSRLKKDILIFEQLFGNTETLEVTNV